MGAKTIFAACQGIDFRRIALGSGAKLGLGTAPAYNLIREQVPFLEEDAVMYPHIETIREQVASGERCCASLIESAQKRIAQEPDAEIDYIQICHAQTLADMEHVDRHAVMLLAVRFGKTRLIDNHHLMEEN